MLNWNPFWPQTSLSGAATPAGAAAAFPKTWDPASMLEFQTQCWNQWLEMSRSLWSVYTTPMQTMPWLLNAAPPVAVAEALAEPIAAADAASNTLESQTRLWNHLLDASRSFWSNSAWEMPDTPWTSTLEAANTALRKAPAAAPATRRAAAAPATRAKRAPAKRKAKR